MSAPSGYTALDFVGFTDKGTYNPLATYMRNDLVHYGGNIWKCLVDNTTGITPVEGANWTLWIGTSANLAERTIAPLLNNPADAAFGVGRQVIYDDWLWEVIAPIAIGDTLIDYAVDPTNANIKKSNPVETQLLAVKAEADATDNMIAPTETNASSSSAAYAVGDQLILNNILYTVTAPVTIGDALVSGTGGNIEASDNLTDQLADKVDSSDLGTAAAKDSTNAVTQNSTDLVESGAVYSEVNTVKQALTSENLGNIASISALETALTNLIPNIELGAVKPFIFSNTANLGSPFPQVTGGWSGTIQPRSTANANVNSALIHIWNQLGHNYSIIGFDNNGTFTWYEDGWDGATVKMAASKGVISNPVITNNIAANTSMDNAIGTLLNNDRAVFYGMSTWSWWNESQTNKVGAIIPARKWFFWNGKLCRALAEIAKDAAMTLNTNYKQVSLLDTLGSTETLYSGKTLDGTVKNLAYDVRRYRYIVIEFRTNLESDYMIIPISELLLNKNYMRVFIGEHSGNQGLVSAMDLMANVRVTFMSYTTFKAVGAYTYDGWQAGVQTIKGIY